MLTTDLSKPLIIVAILAIVTGILLDRQLLLWKSAEPLQDQSNDDGRCSSPSIQLQQEVNDLARELREVPLELSRDVEAMNQAIGEMDQALGQLEQLSNQMQRLEDLCRLVIASIAAMIGLMVLNLAVLWIQLRSRGRDKRMGHGTDEPLRQQMDRGYSLGQRNAGGERTTS